MWIGYTYSTPALVVNMNGCNVKKIEQSIQFQFLNFCRV